MTFKGGMVNGTLAAVYGAISYICLFLASNQHQTMQTVCYVLAGLGLLLGIYWLAAREVMSIPVLIMSVLHVGLGARSPHESMLIGCTGLAVVAFFIGVLMLTRVRAPGSEM